MGGSPRSIYNKTGASGNRSMLKCHGANGRPAGALGTDAGGAVEGPFRAVRVLCRVSHSAVTAIRFPHHGHIEPVVPGTQFGRARPSAAQYMPLEHLVSKGLERLLGLDGAGGG